jgi:hypothetical protein
MDSRPTHISSAGSRLRVVSFTPDHKEEICSMNTLPRATTAQVFPDSSAYLALRHQWSMLMNSDRRHELTAAHHLLYLALCGKDWRTAFRPPTNQRKLDNGGYYNWGLFPALRTVQYSQDEDALLGPFAGCVTPEMLTQVRTWLASLNLYHYAPVHFVGGTFPFPAYPALTAEASHA